MVPQDADDVGQVRTGEGSSGTDQKAASRQAVGCCPALLGNAVPVSSEADLMWVPVGPQAQLEEERAVHLHLAGHPICLARSRGRIHALLDVCSHGQVALSEGELHDGRVECWLHGSRFDLATGRPTGPGAPPPSAPQTHRGP